MKPTIKEAIISVLSSCNKVSNYNLEKLVRKIKPGCCAHTIHRERRKIKEFSIESEQKGNTNTYYYRLA